ncbi:CvpA family protein [Halomonas salipaludis]|uniref:Colicin V production protein n=1 Tax=Halomonas salipaludis TaxID=2032625 RepID=A0A2A2EMW7_9GAMM|nr:CvpA family protein [Halomonas salipaludis]PAU74701.1 colicin V production protein [Halomonas salipaludis]
MSLTWLDMVFLAVLAISMLAGFMRGLIREGLGLAAWIIALVAARMFAEPVADMLSGLIDNADGRLVLSFILVIFVVIMICGLVIRAVHAAVEWVGMGFFNRVAGAGFGVLRGAAILVLVTVLISLTPLSQLEAWRDAELRPTFEELRSWVISQVEAWEQRDPERTEAWRNISLPGFGDGNDQDDMLDEPGGQEGEAPAVR